MPKINPFKSTGPVSPGMFAGRLEELDRLESSLLQTRAGNPLNFMIVGERGIGKSSLLFYLKAQAEGDIPVAGTTVRFLVIDTDIDPTTTQVSLIRKIGVGLRRGLAETEKARTFFKDVWSFAQRLETGAISIRRQDQNDLDDVTIEEFTYGLARTVNALCEGDPALFRAKYEGVLLLVDEADNASKHLHLGSFLKLLSERLPRRGCGRFMVGLAGLPELRSVLLGSHPSSLRVFEEIELDRLSDNEVKRVIRRGVAVGSELNGRAITVSEEAEDFLVKMSEGFPHFVQQFCFSAFHRDTDFVIDNDDVAFGAFGPNGALESIGNRYYRNDFYNKIKKDSYRQVLRIMAEHLDDWVTKETIRAAYKGSTTTLDSAIQALRTRNIIISKEGERGVYRLQNRGFAFWIKLYTAQTDQQQSMLPEA